VPPPGPKRTQSTHVDWSSYRRGTSRCSGPSWVSEMILAVHNDGSLCAADVDYHPRHPGGVPSHSLRLFICAPLPSLPSSLPSPSLPYSPHLSHSIVLAFRRITSQIVAFPRIPSNIESCPWIFRPHFETGHWHILLVRARSCIDKGVGNPRRASQKYLVSIQAPHQILFSISGLHVGKERFDALSLGLFGCNFRYCLDYFSGLLGCILRGCYMFESVHCVRCVNIWI